MKIEIRSSKSERSPKSEARGGVPKVLSSAFAIRPSFGLRNSDIGFSRSGFTLIELILVMVVLAVVLAVSAPALSRFFKSRGLESEAKRFMALTRHAQSRAVSEGVPMVLWLEPKQRLYGLNADSSFIEEDPLAEQFNVDETVEVEVWLSAEAIQAGETSVFKNEKQTTTELQTLRFNPDGFVSLSSPEAVIFRQGKENELWVAQSRNRLNYEIQAGKPGHLRR
jgi:type II secretion system protein H